MVIVLVNKNKDVFINGFPKQMNYSSLKSSILAQFAVKGGNKVVPFLVGKPGGGKSSCAREIAEELAKKHQIPAERIVEFNPSLREPTDILGLPQMDGDHSRWLPPEEFYVIRQGTGPAVLILEELSDAQMDMQNPLCRVILDRHAGQMPLTDELFIIATGNRTEDRSGASRLSTKLANRMRVLKFEENLDDWCDWAAAHSIDPMITAFLRFRPALLSDFDAARSCNPTPRSWEDVSRIPEDLPLLIFAEHVAGAVGDGAAAEYLGFRKIYKSLPNMEAILADPLHAQVPEKPDVQYAVVGKLVTVVTKKNFAAAVAFMERFPKEFLVLFMREALRRNAWVGSSKLLLKFAAENRSLFL